MIRNLLDRSTIVLLLFVLVVSTVTVYLVSEVDVSAGNQSTSGALTVVDSSGKAKATCPLKHTDVKAEISGFISRVTVTQEFANNFKEKIEAVYTFPLPQNAAVDDMTMTIGSRTVKGKILPREEAQAVYDAAKTKGQVASLLDQERTNIFTQSVANIMPGEQVKITISYVETLNYEDGAYEFVFPMVVGPRYIPGNVTSSTKGNSFAADTDQVPDASRVSPSMAPPGMRSGHDVSLDIQIDAGLLVDELTSKSHQVNITRPDPRSARVTLKDSATIPNKDFILRYNVGEASLQDAVLTHRSDKGGFFTMILQPPDRVNVSDVSPKELVFVLDTSGSMEGFPIEKAKESMDLALANLYPSDTFNLITFAGDTRILFPEPVPATKANLQKARSFLKNQQGSGGTQMMTAIKAALDPSDKKDHMRVVCFMTDGYVGNDMEIIAEIQKHQNARVFAFGIGESVNRFLLDKMAQEGRGEVEYVSLGDDGSIAARRFHERVRNPLLTDISIEWNGLPIADVYPKRIPDLFSAKPLILSGRFTAPASGTIRLKGKMAGNEVVREIPVSLPETMASHDVLSTLWARRRVDDLMAQDYNGAQQGTMKDDLKQTITQIGMEYRLLTQFTSFVAVEEMIVTDGGEPRRIDVPVEVPAGVNHEMVDGNVRILSSFYLGRSRGGSGGGGGSMRPSGTLVAPGPPNLPPSVSVDARVVRGAPIKVSPMPVPAPTPATVVATNEPTVEKKDAATEGLRKKLHSSVFAVTQRLKNNKLAASAGESRFIKEGKAELQVWLVDKSEANLKKLKELGLEVILDQPNSSLVIGRVSIEKLQELGELSFVRYVSPLMK